MSPVQAVDAQGKIWIDLDNSPHVPLFKPVIEALQCRGYAVVLTGRNCFQVPELVDHFHLDCTMIGRHYGKNKLLKVLGTGLRALQLRDFIQRHQPHLAVSHGSRGQLLLANMLRLPSVLMMDYEYNRFLPGMSPTMLLMPEVLEGWAQQHRSSWRRRVILKRFYPGIKEDVYVPQFEPDPRLLSELGMHQHDYVVTIRPPATEAHYHRPESDQLYEATITHLGMQDAIKMVMLPRTPTQAEYIATRWPQWVREGKIIIPQRAVDGLNLIWFSDFVISGGGTMNREAAALGVPVYSTFRGTIGVVDQYLSRAGRLVLLENAEDVKTKIAFTRRDKSVSPKQGNTLVLDSIVDQLIALVEASRRSKLFSGGRKYTSQRLPDSQTASRL